MCASEVLQAQTVKTWSHCPGVLLRPLANLSPVSMHAFHACHSSQISERYNVRATQGGGAEEEEQRPDL